MARKGTADLIGVCDRTWISALQDGVGTAFIFSEDDLMAETGPIFAGFD